MNRRKRKCGDQSFKEICFQKQMLNVWFKKLGKVLLLVFDLYLVLLMKVQLSRESLNQES